MAFSPGFSNVRRQLLPLSHAQSPCDVSIGQRLVPNILLQHGSAALTGAPPQFPSSLSHLVMLMLLRDKVPLATAPQALRYSRSRGLGERGASFRSWVQTPLRFVPSEAAPTHQGFLAVRLLLLSCISLSPYLPAAPCESCGDHPCSVTQRRGASPGPPRGQRAPGQWETGFRTRRSSCLYFKALVEWDWDFCQNLARGKVFSGSVHTMKDFFIFFFPPLLYSDTFLTGSAK